MVTKKPLGSILLVLRKQYAQNVGVVDYWCSRRNGGTRQADYLRQIP